MQCRAYLTLEKYFKNISYQNENIWLHPKKTWLFWHTSLSGFKIVIMTMSAYVAQCVAVNQSNALGHVFATSLCHSRQTHRFRWCSVAAKGDFDYPAKNSRNGSEVKLLLLCHCLSQQVIAVVVFEPTPSKISVPKTSTIGPFGSLPLERNVGHVTRCYYNDYINNLLFLKIYDFEEVWRVSQTYHSSSMHLVIKFIIDKSLSVFCQGAHILVYYMTALLLVLARNYC